MEGEGFASVACRQRTHVVLYYILTVPAEDDGTKNKNEIKGVVSSGGYSR